MKRQPDYTMHRVKEARFFTTDGAKFCSPLIKASFSCQPPMMLSINTEYTMTRNTACAILDARLLLPKTHSLFIMWQKKLRPESELGRIHDALEYHLFIKHRDALISSAKLPSITQQSHMERNCGHSPPSFRHKHKRTLPSLRG